MKSFLVFSVFLALAVGQQIGKQAGETHPQVTIQTCTKSGGCTDEPSQIVLDANWRWTHKVGTYTPNCYTGDEWDSSVCPDPVTCAQNCAIDGANYEGTYGVIAGGNTVQINFVTPGQYGKNVGARVYLMDTTETYKQFKLKGREFTFDVDVSELPCGLNGALYFTDMDADGGKSKYPNDQAGAEYGTGYCDAQCPHDIKFINGEANLLDWKPSPTDPNSGTGKYGTCCTEMDIWEANSIATAYTAHDCNVTGQYRCSGIECGDDSAGQRFDGVCDKDGCDLNPYRMGDKTFFGNDSSFAVDTTQLVTVITQFITSDNTTSGDLVEIRRLFKQNGKVIPTRPVQVGNKTFDSLSDDFCDAQKTLFGDPNMFSKKGGMKKMGQDLDEGMVLVLSLWDDYAAHMLWLDSSYPPSKDPSAPGVSRGPCSPNSGDPKDVESRFPNANVKFSNIKVGEIGSTF
eukprot:m.124857 g.124857  ORF g.124857 m.124857 type:complete len:458 (+) comp23437_c0_seq1:1498-2871(+)